MFFYTAIKTVVPRSYPHSEVLTPSAKKCLSPGKLCSSFKFFYFFFSMHVMSREDESRDKPADHRSVTHELGGGEGRRSQHRWQKPKMPSRRDDSDAECWITCLWHRVTGRTVGHDGRRKTPQRRIYCPALHLLRCFTSTLPPLVSFLIQ